MDIIKNIKGVGSSDFAAWPMGTAPSQVIKELDHLPEGKTKTLFTAVAEAVSSASSAKESGDDSTATTIIANAADDIVSNLGSSLDADDDSGPVIGLAGAIAALSHWIGSLNDLQGTLSKMTEEFSRIGQELSQKEIDRLDKDNEEVNKAAKAKDSTAVTAAQIKYQTDQQYYSSLKTVVQGLAEAFQNAVSNLAKTTDSDYTNIGTMNQLWASLANVIR